MNYYHYSPNQIFIFSIGLLGVKELINYKNGNLRTDITQYWIIKHDYNEKDSPESVRLNIGNMEKDIGELIKKIHRDEASRADDVHKGDNLKKVNGKYTYISFGDRPVLFILPGKFQKKVTYYEDTYTYLENNIYAYNFLAFLHSKEYQFDNWYIRRIMPYSNTYTQAYKYIYGTDSIIKITKKYMKEYCYVVDAHDHAIKNLENAMLHKLKTIGIEQIDVKQIISYYKKAYQKMVDDSALHFLHMHNRVIFDVYLNEHENVRITINWFDIMIKLFFYIDTQIKLINFLYGYSYFDLPVANWMRAIGVYFDANTIYRRDIDETKTFFPVYHQAAYIIDKTDTDDIYIHQGPSSSIDMIDVDNIKIQSLTVEYRFAQARDYRVITMQNISKIALTVMMNKQVTYFVSIRSAKLLVIRHREINKIHPNIHTDHFIAGAVMCSVPKTHPSKSSTYIQCYV